MRVEQAGMGMPARAGLVTAALLLLVAMVFGGGSRGQGDLVVHLVAAPALAVAILCWRHSVASPLQRAFLYLLIAAAALMALQLLPIGSDLFGQLRGRDGIAPDLQVAGVDNAWLATTLNPFGTLRALLALLVFASVWMLASMLAPEQRQQLVRLVLLLAFTMALLGFAQAAAGRYSALRFHDFHHPVGAIGTFANRNHFADLMALLIPFALCMGKPHFERGRAGAGRLLWAGVTVVLFLAAALSFSRTGFALACVALAAGWLVQPSQTGFGRAVARWAAPLAVAASCVLAVGYYAWRGIVQRLEQDPLDDLRWQYLANGTEAVRTWLPWGSGFGSFREVYAPFEPVADMGRSFAMHAHNDALEIALEGGVPGLLLLCGAMVLLAWAAASALRQRCNTDPLVLAATVAVFVPLLHSLVDYPLRTLAIAAVFGLVVAVLLSPNRDAALGRA